MSDVQTLVVATASGRLRGYWDSGVATFKGIPYAAAPIGPMRFKAPEKFPPWHRVRDALTYGAQSLQTSADMALMGAPDVVGLLFEAPERTLNSEDCLFLNVWTPGLSGARPVMVWCHSGGFFSGSGAAPHCEGTRLSRNGDIVVVTLNHRLGLLGFLHLGEIAGEEYAESGNAGLLDIVAALEWIRDHIAELGGDPNNVTLFGQSGGGAKVNSLMAMPRARKLFHRAIIQSGAWRRFREASDASSLAELALAQLGLTAGTWRRLSELPAQAVMLAQHEIMKQLVGRPQAADGALAERHLGPVRDGRVLPHHPFSEAAIHDSAAITLMLGTTRDEGTFFMSADPQLASLDTVGLKRRVESLVGNDASALIAAYERIDPAASAAQIMVDIITDHIVRIPAMRQAELRVSAGTADVYLYIFCYETDALGGKLRATHGVDIPYVFDNVAEDPLAGTKASRHVFSHDLSRTWAAFARSGRPQYRGLQWPAYDCQQRPTMLLDADSRVARDPESARRRIWENWRRLNP